MFGVVITGTAAFASRTRPRPLLPHRRARRRRAGLIGGRCALRLVHLRDARAYYFPGSLRPGSSLSQCFRRPAGYYNLLISSLCLLRGSLSRPSRKRKPGRLTHGDVPLVSCRGCGAATLIWWSRKRSTRPTSSSRLDGDHPHRRLRTPVTRQRQHRSSRYLAGAILDVNYKDVTRLWDEEQHRPARCRSYRKRETCTKGEEGSEGPGCPKNESLIERSAGLHQGRSSCRGRRRHARLRRDLPPDQLRLCRKRAVQRHQLAVDGGPGVDGHTHTRSRCRLPRHLRPGHVHLP